VTDRARSAPGTTTAARTAAVNWDITARHAGSVPPVVATGDVPAFVSLG
jgi:hypothetical protein